MGYTTFGKVLKWIEKPTGLTVKDNRAELVDYANQIRRHFYLLYESLPLFLDAEECFELERFCTNCQDCDDSYLGFTLPRGMLTPEAAWHNRHPVRLNGKWREWRDGLRFGDYCKIDIHEVNGMFPTEREISPCGCATPIKFKAKSECDVGKIVSIRYIDANNEEIEELIEIDTDYSATDGEAISIVDGGILFSEDMVGGVVIAQGDGKILSNYSPGESVPAYRRFKVNGLKDDDQVIIRANRDFCELYYDSDVVETDNQLAYIEMAQYFRLNESSDGEMKAQAAIHARNAKGYLLGQKSREQGKGVIFNFRYNEGPVRRSGLRKNNRRRW